VHKPLFTRGRWSAAEDIATLQRWCGYRASKTRSVRWQYKTQLQKWDQRTWPVRPPTTAGNHESIRSRAHARKTSLAQWRVETKKPARHWRNEGEQRGTMPRVPSHWGSPQKSQQCHKYLLQYSTFASERPKVSTSGAKLVSYPGRHLPSVRLCSTSSKI